MPSKTAPRNPAASVIWDDDLQFASTADGQIDGVISSDAIHRGVARLHLTTDHSGLACTWKSDWPVAPVGGTRSRINGAVKRVLDVMLSGSALLVLSPILLSVALAIKLTDPGPVFYRQDRMGRDCKIFRVFKFRTMHHHLCDTDGVAQARENDVRVTTIGRIMRKRSVDELPQLINIFRGDMSTVGPRPHPVGQLADGELYELVVPYYSCRYAIKPGLTGWAQVNGLRGPTDDRQRAVARIDHDMAYVQNMSLWLDIKIIFLTAWREFLTGSGH